MPRIIDVNILEPLDIQIKQHLLLMLLFDRYDELKCVLTAKTITTPPYKATLYPFLPLHSDALFVQLHGHMCIKTSETPRYECLASFQLYSMPRNISTIKSVSGKKNILVSFLPIFSADL